MSKRVVNNQQKRRIKAQQERQNLRLSNTDNVHQGLVLTRLFTDALVEDKAGVRRLCAIRPSITSIVAGDRVIWQEEGEAKGVIINRYPRETELCKPNKQGQLKTVAANITQLIIVIAPNPSVSWTMLDSYLIAANQLGLKALIVLNKIDANAEEEKNTLDNVYRPLGYQYLAVSSQQGTYMQALFRSLKDETSVFVGQSGVGKSSIIATLCPNEKNVTIGDLSTNSQLGKHTTTNSVFYHLPNGGALIDSPGVREFRLLHFTERDIHAGYPEFERIKHHCRFRNCDHQTSPGCAIKKAIESGDVALIRYKNYVHLINKIR